MVLQVLKIILGHYKIAFMLDFYILWIFEFAAIVSEYNRKGLRNTLKEILSVRSLMALMTHSCVQLGSSMQSMKLDFLNKSVSMHLPFLLFPRTVSISTTSDSSWLSMKNSKSLQVRLFQYAC